ncbi:hypothetical protein M758_4G053000 [Ceratodon purpureus]|nr:hypothetical protein M758_4G053000 [Ceratodon purpureus]
MARPFWSLPCEPEMKWVIKAGINIDPATLAKNLTILCTVAFSATVLYVMYSNSKTPQYNQYTQVSLSDDEEVADEDHTIQCKTRCRHSIVGNSDRTRPPERLMSFGIPLDDVKSPSTRGAYCPLDSTLDVNMGRIELGGESLRNSDTLNVQIQPSTDSCMASDPFATNGVDTSAAVRQDDYSSRIDNVETQTKPPIVASVLNSSCDAESQTMPESIMLSILNASNDVSVAVEASIDGALSSIESLFSEVQPSTICTASGPDVVETPCTQIQPSTICTASGPDVVETPCIQIQPSTICTASGPDVVETPCIQIQPSTICTASGPDVVETPCIQIQPLTICTASGSDFVETPCIQIQPSTSTNAASGAKEFDSSCTQTLPPTTSTASGPDVTPAGSLDDPGFCSGFTKDPDCTRAKVGFLRHLEEGESLVRNGEELDAIQCDSMEKDDDGGNQFEGYICGIIREKGSKLCKRRIYGRVSFAQERREQGDGGCFREKIEFGRSDGVRFKEACTQLASGVEVCEKILPERPQKIVEETRKRNSDFISSQESCVNTLSRVCRPRQRDSCTQTEVKAEKGTSVSADLISTSSSREACTGQPLRQLSTIRKDETRHMLGNNFEFRDKGIGNFVDSYSASNNCKKACTGRPLKHLPTLPKEVTRHLLGNNFEKCRDQGTSIPVDTFPQSRTMRAWTGRPFKQTRTVPEEVSCHSIDNYLGVVEECLEDQRREGGMTSVEPESIDPLEQARSSLKTLTETEHWSKMSLPEQYECLGLLDSTLAAASAEWKGKSNVTYWRHKDSAPPSKLSGLPSLCKPEGSTECPNVDRAHLHFQGGTNCTNIASSISREAEQFCSEITCVEAKQILQGKQVHRALSSHPQGYHQLSSLSTGDSLSCKLERSAQNNLHNESNRRANTSAETRRLQSEAAKETRTLSKLLARNSKYHYM